MRIRKKASKLILGSAASPYIASAIDDSPANIVTNGYGDAEEEEEALCKLNRSPWDVMVMSDSNIVSPNCSYDENSFEEEDEGISGNAIKNNEMEPISSLTSTAAELTLKEMKEMESQKVKKKAKKSSNKGIRVVAEEETNNNIDIQYCKKSDGKGWHCKRPAQLPHSRLCSYHLAQCRSYASSNPNHKPTDSSAATIADGGNDDGRKNGQQTRATGADSNQLYYYYYGGFDPRRGKRRGRPAAGDNACGGGSTSGGGVDAKFYEEAGNEDEHLVDGGESTMDVRDDDNVAGDDGEYVNDCFGNDDDEDGGNDGGGNFCRTQQHEVEENGTNKKEGELEKKRKVLKKRGRKPIKARSLKSLL